MPAGRLAHAEAWPGIEPVAPFQSAVFLLVNDRRQGPDIGSTWQAVGLRRARSNSRASRVRV